MKAAPPVIAVDPRRSGQGGTLFLGFFPLFKRQPAFRKGEVVDQFPRIGGSSSRALPCVRVVMTGFFFFPAFVASSSRFLACFFFS